MPEELRHFLHTFKIAEDDFERTNLHWEDLQAIKKHYKGIRKELNLIARYIEDKLQGLEAIHSVRCRVKDPDHLIAKIIRKRIESPSRKITIDNYCDMITDLIGIRAIHLFKEDWVHIHEFIVDTWNLYETPIAYVRAGDSGQHIDEYKRYEFDIETHPYGYRSIHYLVESKPSKDRYIAEIQVRTIFEEGWSEIDHTIKYPKLVADPLLDTFLDNFNILAGNSDQMGSFVRNLKEDLLKGTQKLEMYEKLTEKHAGIIDTLKKRVAGTIGEINAKIRKVEKKLGILNEYGAEARPFERALDKARETVARFERELSHDPQKATELFELSIHELDRLEKLLDIALERQEQLDIVEHERLLVTSYKERAGRFVQNMRTIAELETAFELIEPQHLPVHEESHSKIERAVRAIGTRKGMLRFLIGPKYKAIDELCTEINANKRRVKALAELAERVRDPATQSVLWSQIDLFAEENKHLEDFVTQQTKGISLFGWLFKLLA